MPERWKIGGLVVAVVSTISFGASAFLRQPGEPIAPSIPTQPAPLSAPAPSPFDTPPTAEPTPLAITDVGPRPEPRLPRELDATDPWSTSSTPRVFATTPRRVKPKPRPLDSEDPWSSRAAPAAPERPTSAAPAPSAAARLSDDALREAIKRAIDAGDLDRASKLLEILRAAP